MMLGEDASPEAIAELNARDGFDRPAYVQYSSIWLGSALTGDFGRSYTSQVSGRRRARGRAAGDTRALPVWAILLAVIGGGGR